MEEEKLTTAETPSAPAETMADYEDAIMVETAIRSEMDCIVTRNVKDYVKSVVKVYEPSVFLNLLEVEKDEE